MGPTLQYISIVSRNAYCITSSKPRHYLNQSNRDPVHLWLYASLGRSWSISWCWASSSYNVQNTTSSQTTIFNIYCKLIHHQRLTCHIQDVCATRTMVSRLTAQKMYGDNVKRQKPFWIVTTIFSKRMFIQTHSPIGSFTQQMISGIYEYPIPHLSAHHISINTHQISSISISLEKCALIKWQEGSIIL